MRARGFAVLLGAMGCLDLQDVAGRACDEAHPCRAPRVCVAGTCRDVAESPSDAVEAPRPMASYAVPDAAVRVRTTAELVEALARPHPVDIVVEDGAYEHTSPFVNAVGHRVYAARLGGAVLQAGFEIKGADARLQGISFELSDPGLTLHDSVVHVWGEGRKVQILDCAFEGRGAVRSAIKARQPDGLMIQRISVRGFSGQSVLLDSNAENEPAATEMRVEDVDVSGAGDACLWLGNRVTARRIKLRDCPSSGIHLANATQDATIAHLDVAGTRTGVYVWRAERTIVQRLRIGPEVERGAQCRYVQPGSNDPACVELTIQDGRIETGKVGVYVEEGNSRVTVQRIQFVGQELAAMSDLSGDGTVFAENDTAQLGPGAAEVASVRVQ